MKPVTQWACAFGAVSLLILNAACSTDTSADKTVEQLVNDLSSLTLSNTALLNPESQRGFDQVAESLEEFRSSVVAVEIEYEVDTAVVPLQWDWDIHGQDWHYETEIELNYQDSQWFVAWDPSAFIPGLEPGQLVGIDSVTPQRAEIIDKHQDPIVTLRPLRHYGLDKTYLEDDDPEEAAASIAKATGVDQDAFIDKVNAAGPQAFVEAISVRPEDVDEWIDPDFDSLPGARTVSDEAFLAPTRTFARELLGRVGHPTAEMLEESNGELHAEDLVGLSGLQQRYDSQLRGVDEVEVYAVNSSDCPTPEECEQSKRHSIVTLEPKAPRPLQLTLDIDLQIEAERILARALGDEAETIGASLVAIRPSTKEILVIANGEGNQGLNHATTGQYPPGSTFKTVTALALLRQGYAITDHVSCPKSLTVDGREFTNYDAYPVDKTGEITFEEAFAYSCNTAWIDLMGDISAEDLYRAAQSLGLATTGNEEDLGFPTFFSDIADPKGETDFAATVLGQGKTTTSPLGLATVAASIYAGETVVPTLIPAHSPPEPPAPPLTSQEAKHLQDLMQAVVTKGTGQGL